MNFQKQFDTITGALSLFDLSYWISGTALLLSLVYVNPKLMDFLVQDNKLFLSMIFCLITAYVAGLVSWVIGKRLRYLFMVIYKRKIKAVKIDFENLFAEAIHVCNISDRSKIKNMLTKSKTLTYSYMWMKLDQSDNTDCKRRFDYICRFWTFRAIYEGLIPPVLIMSVAFYCNYITKCSCELSCLCKVVSSFDICVCLCTLTYGCFVLFLVGCLALEARKCFKTQLREVVLAFSVFCGEEM